MKELTKAEEQVMHRIWKLEKAFVKDIHESFPEPRPAYTTITTLIRILVRKGFVAFRTYGKANEYYPLVSKKKYMKSHFSTVIRDYFNNNLSGFASFFTKESGLSLEELEKIREIVDQEIKEKKNDQHVS